MSETKVNLGFLPVNRGTYSNSATYYKDNIVQYNGSSYICTQDPGSSATPQGITGEVPYVSQPDVPNTHWAVFANNQGGPVEGIYDISANHATDNIPKAYDSLSAALADVPTAKKTGGLVVKFIQTTPATYNVVKTEGVTELPTGIELDSASSIASGTYTASQLSDFSTLPTTATPVVYYISNSGEITTYTTWTITKVQSSDNKYVQFRYMLEYQNTIAGNDAFLNTTNWQGVDENPTPGSDNLVESGGVYSAARVLERIINERVPLTEEDGFFITDENGNIGFCLLNGKVDALGFGNNLIAKIKDLICNNTDVIDVVNTNLLAADKITLNGSDIILKYTDEDGIYFVDENGWIGAQYVNGTWSFSDLSNNIETFPSNHALIVRANDTLKQVRALNDKIDNAIPSLLTLKDGSEQTSKTVTISNSTAKDKAVVRLCLHYGSEKYTPDSKDIFFGGSCKTDFSDVRFFDGNGNILKASFSECFNLGVYKDTRIKDNLKVTSQGYLVGYDSGVVVSMDNGDTWVKIANTTNVTEHASDVYSYTSIQPIYIGKSANNLDYIFGYAGGKLYKIVTDYSTLDGNNQLAATITEVFDFSWDYNGTTVYPDVQPHAMDADINGVLYFGAYQKTKYYHVQVFVSTDGGDSWTEKYLYYNQTDKNQQHVHHIHADKYSTKVYVGIDAGLPAQGPTVIVSDDAGNTWTDITTQLKVQRGHDYYPTYFGTDYKLGGGENFTLGGNTIVRGDASDNNLKIVHKGYGGVRSFADFGNDNLIIAGVQNSSLFLENQIVLSTDKGKTWHLVSKTDTPNVTSSGGGYRDAIFCGTIASDTEPCIILPKGSYVKPTRIYNGMDYYREVEIEIDDVPASNITIVAKTGYVMPYPYTTVRGVSEESVYSIPLNEGCGILVQDSLGNITEVNGSIEWEKEEEPVRYGEYSFGKDKPFGFSSAAKITGIVNFGKIDSLNFSYGYTITMWINEKNRKCNYDYDERYSHNYIDDRVIHVLASLGSFDIVRVGSRVGLIPRGADNVTTRILATKYDQALDCSDNYYFLCLVIASDGITAYVNGCNYTSALDGSWDGYKDNLLSSKDVTIGSKDSVPCGFISDFKIYNRELSHNEIIDIYKGFNF